MSSRSLRSWGYLGVGVVAAYLVWIPAALLLAHPGAFGLDFATRELLRTLAATLAMLVAIVFATLGFRAADEFTQQASKFAWYWGGAGGVAVSAPIYVFVVTGGLRLLGLARPLVPTAPATMAAVGRAGASGFMLGYALMGVSLLAGFAVARLWWSLAKR
jgi:hypothetical protein